MEEALSDLLIFTSVGLVTSSSRAAQEFLDYHSAVAFQIIGNFFEMPSNHVQDIQICSSYEVRAPQVEGDPAPEGPAAAPASHGCGTVDHHLGMEACLTPGGVLAQVKPNEENGLRRGSIGVNFGSRHPVASSD